MTLDHGPRWAKHPTPLDIHRTPTPDPGPAWWPPIGATIRVRFDPSGAHIVGTFVAESFDDGHRWLVVERTTDTGTTRRLIRVSAAAVISYDVPGGAE